MLVKKIHGGLATISAKPQEADTEDSALAKSRPRRMLNEKQLLDIVPLSRTSIYRLEKAGKFPRSTYISANRRIWYEDEIVAWQNAVDEFDPARGRGKGRRVRAVAAFGGKADTR
jgi:predicted DNA-binding transcriptional regulator AlpA